MEKILFLDTFEKLTHNMHPIVNAMDDCTFKLIHFGSLYNPQVKKHYFENKLEIIDFTKYKTSSLIKIIKKEKPSLIIITDKGGILHRAFCYVAKTMKVPILQIQHGIVPNLSVNKLYYKQDISKYSTKMFSYFKMLIIYFKSLNSYDSRFFLKRKNWFYLSKIFTPKKYYYYYRDEVQANKCLCYGKKDKDFYVQRDGYKPGDVEVVGNYLFDATCKKLTWPTNKITKLKEEYGFKSKDNIAGILTQPFVQDRTDGFTKNDYRKIMLDICTALDRLNIKTIIKIHPRENKSDYAYLKEINSVFILNDKPLDEVVLISNFVIGWSSASLYNAVILKKHILIPNFHPSLDLLLESFNLAKLGLAHKSINLIDFELSIQKTLKKEYNTKTYTKNNENFVEQHLYSLDGQSVYRVVQSIKKLL